MINRIITFRAGTDFKEHLVHLYLTEKVKAKEVIWLVLINKQLSMDRSQVSDSHYPVYIFSSNDSSSVKIFLSPSPHPHCHLSLPLLCLQLHLVLSFMVALINVYTVINCLHAYLPIRLWAYLNAGLYLPHLWISWNVSVPG